MGQTLKELSAQFAKKQPTQVDHLTGDAPVLGVIPFEQASHGLWNMYEEIDEITGAGWVEMNAPLPSLDVAANMRKIDLSILGGEIECPEDTANVFGGKEMITRPGQDLRHAELNAQQAVPRLSRDF